MKKKYPWQSGDVFLVENKDGKYTVGQVLAFETRTLHSSACAFFDLRVDSQKDEINAKLDINLCFSTLLSTTVGLDRGIWKVVERRPLLLPKTAYPYYELFSRKQPGAMIWDSALVEGFLNAFHSLQPWDDSYDPNFYDALLLNTSKKPKDLILIKS